MTGASVRTPVDLRLTPEQDELASSLRRLLERASTSRDVRRVMQSASGHDEALWQSLVAMGIPAVGLPEEFSGSGESLTDVLVVSRELGRVLACTPFFATTVLAGSALVCGEDPEVRREILPELAAGGVTATFWPGIADARSAAQGQRVLASERPGGWRLDGQANFVLDGGTAALIVVAAESGQGPTLLLADTRQAAIAQTVTRRLVTTMDATRRQATLQFASTPARLVGPPGQAGGGVSAALDRAMTALAAEQAGGAERCLESAVGYARQRVQFGKPIGSFQAVKHRCADILLTVDAAASAAHFAAWTADNDPESFPLAAAIAGESATEAYLFAARECLHLHGGIGFTWEHDAHLYFRRARASAVQFGSTGFYRELVADRCGL